jgi:hypothetical protein
MGPGAFIGTVLGMLAKMGTFSELDAGRVGLGILVGLMAAVNGLLKTAERGLLVLVTGESTLAIDGTVFRASTDAFDVADGTGGVGRGREPDET